MKTSLLGGRARRPSPWVRLLLFAGAVSLLVAGILAISLAFSQPAHAIPDGPDTSQCSHSGQEENQEGNLEIHWQCGGYVSTENRVVGFSENEGCTVEYDGLRDTDPHLQTTCDPAFQRAATDAEIDSGLIGTEEGEEGAAGTNDEDDPGTACEAFGSALGWFICPMVNGLLTFTQELDRWISDLMTVDTGALFNTGSNDENEATSDAYYTAWSSFRTIALGLVVIVALIIIISNTFGFEILDAYTIRKAMPRVLVAVILMTLSWDILEFFVTLSNDVGNGVRSLIYTPFSGLEQVQIEFGEQSVIALLLGGGLFFMGILGILSFAVTAAIAVLVAFLVLVLREMIIVLLVIVAPIAFALFILPNTQKYWQFWQNTLTAMLIAFPIIAAFIATGRVFSAVAFQDGDANVLNNLIAFVAYFLPYFLLPLVFRMAGGLLAQMGNIANNSERGAFDRLKKYRGRKTSENVAAMKAGKRIKSDNFLAKGINSTTRGAANLQNAGFNPWRMRSRLQSGASTSRATEMAEYMDKSAAWKGISGNDDYLQATMENMGGGETEDDWRRYLTKQGYSGQALEQGVAQIRAAKRETSSEVFHAAAVVANASTGTGWKEGGAAQMLESINGVAGNDRHMASNMLAQMRGSAVQAGRLDLGGAGFGTTAGVMNDLYTGDTNATTANRKLAQNILLNKGPSDFARTRGEATERLAPHMLDNLREGHEKVRVAKASGNTQAQQNAERELAQEYAALDNLHDSLSHMAPEGARNIADSVLGQPVGRDEAGKAVTVMDQIDQYQKGTVAGSEAFNETKRVFGVAQRGAENVREGVQPHDEN